MRRSVHSGGAVLAVALALAAPGAARAVNYGMVQFQAVPGVSDPHLRPFTEIAGQTNVCSGMGCQGAGGKPDVDIGFTFGFYGTSYTKVSISDAGILTFDHQTWGGPTVTTTIPDGTDDPKGLIAPMWFRSMNGASVDYVSEGDAPNRRFTAQWKGFTAQTCMAGPASCNTYDWQVTLYESSNAIEFHYRRTLPPSGDDHFTSQYGMGIESTANGNVGIDSSPGFPAGCTPTCALKDFPDGMITRFTPGADAAISGLSFTNADQCATFGAGPCLFAGQTVDVTASMTNSGGDAINGVRTRLYLTTDPNIDPHGNGICTTGTDPTCVQLNPESGPVNLLGGATSNNTLKAVKIPADRTPGVYWLVGVADDDNAVAEDDESNNTFVYPTPIILRAGGPDLAIPVLTPPGLLGHTDPSTVHVTIANQGFVTLDTFPLALALSANSVITMQDIVVWGPADALALTDHGPLQPGDSVDVPIPVTVPATVPNDSNLNNVSPNDHYYFGAIADPLNAIAEVDELHNTNPGPPGGVEVGGGDVTMVTNALPDAGLGSAYSVQMIAGGGTGVLHWTATGGPTGLAIDETSGLYHGIAGEKGTFDMTFSVNDDAGKTASAHITFHVNPSLLPLAITTVELPYASFGVPYDFGMGAVGGCPPYTWTLVTTDPTKRLPAGMSMGPDGRLKGSPREAGAFPLALHVEDTTCGNKTDTGDGFVLTVTEPPSLTISSSELPLATIGMPYSAQLTAAGGTGVTGPSDYTWSLAQVIRLPEGPGDKGERLKDGTPPPGLVFGPDGSITSKDGPTVAGSYLLGIKVSDPALDPPATTVISLRVSFATGMTITTLSLEDAVIGKDYKQPLDVSGQTGTVTWSLADSGSLPKGLQLDPSGTVVGAPSTDAIQSGDSQIYAFIVNAKDEADRTASRPLSIRVLRTTPQQPPPKAYHLGCSSSAGVPGGLALLLGLALLRRRRDRR